MPLHRSSPSIVPKKDAIQNTEREYVEYHFRSHRFACVIKSCLHCLNLRDHNSCLQSVIRMYALETCGGDDTKEMNISLSANANISGELIVVC